MRVQLCILHRCVQDFGLKVISWSFPGKYFFKKFLNILNTFSFLIKSSKHFSLHLNIFIWIPQFSYDFHKTIFLVRSAAYLKNSCGTHFGFFDFFLRVLDSVRFQKYILFGFRFGLVKAFSKKRDTIRPRHCEDDQW